MGNLCSSISDNAKTTPQPRQVELPQTTSDWAPGMRNTIESKEGSSQHTPSTANFNTDTRCDAQLPAYSSRPPSTIKMLDVLKKANELDMCGIKSAFNGLCQRHFHVWIDSNYMVPRNTKSAIRLFAVNLLQVAKAIDCNLTIFFTGCPNTTSQKLPEEDQARLKVLEKLWVTQSWQEAKKLVHRIKKLRELGFQEWMNTSANFTNEDSDDERHTRLLIHIRQRMLPYWHGYHQRDLTAETLVAAHRSAIHTARKQPKALNNIRFTYEREIKHYQRLMYSDKAYPFTALFLMASAMQPTEIKECQKYGSNTRDQKGKGDIEGRGTQFCIQSIVMTENLDEDAIKRYGQIDNFQGEDGINDVTTIKESQVLKHFFSPECLLKTLNGHNRIVYNMKLSENQKYNHDQFPDHNLTISDLSEVREALGIEYETGVEGEGNKEVDHPSPSGVNAAILDSSAVNNHCPDSSTFGFSVESTPG